MIANNWKDSIIEIGKLSNFIVVQIKFLIDIDVFIIQRAENISL